ncbi:hypothetical protein CDEST_05960 [Colletotrichum destructivum]|uniref:Uncharacterized protein n=1 Tax=Colletotrichum destructivum TaxID=34406 RepID=A0AAX4IC58_9PEZI|nr:hypothetical protein CDEST_05960 [Colletotrichum destructivum]
MRMDSKFFGYDDLHPTWLVLLRLAATKTLPTSIHLVILRNATAEQPESVISPATSVRGRLLLAKECVGGKTKLSMKRNAIMQAPSDNGFVNRPLPRNSQPRGEHVRWREVSPRDEA